jgi:ABC-type protease/lipase transport system fused ATPase/permease subunit
VSRSERLAWNATVHGQTSDVTAVKRDAQQVSVMGYGKFLIILDKFDQEYVTYHSIGKNRAIIPVKKSSANFSSTKVTV